jgi:endonuclease/exonuclease/phosphatase (EEP) superfamily protein YafD
LEQTAIVHARVCVSDRSLHTCGVWLGLKPDEQARQSDDALPHISAASPAILGGDLNATPDPPTYARMRAAGFNDPFVADGFDLAPTSPAIEPTKRIDFVWARELEAKDAQVLDSLASDHRMVVVELALR